MWYRLYSSVGINKKETKKKCSFKAYYVCYLNRVNSIDSNERYDQSVLCSTYYCVCVITEARANDVYIEKMLDKI